MIKCAKCGKENQDHYKFCLGCGSELPKHAPKEFQAQKSAGSESGSGYAATAEPPAPPAAALAATTAPAALGAQAPAVPEVIELPPQVACPQCGHSNPPSNRFCAACGYKLGGLAAAPSAAPPAASEAGSGVSLTALRADGTEAGRYFFPAGPVITIGRDTGTIFAGDSYLSPRHASFSQSAEGLTVRDEGSLNGVYIKLVPHTPFALEAGAVFRIGQEIVRFEQLESQPPLEGVDRFGSPAHGIIGRLALVIGRDTTGNAFPIPRRGLHLGRERGDVLFSEDGYVSGLHCRIQLGEDGRVYLTDVGSSNGTFVRVRDNHPLSSGDILLMGQQVFRVDLGA